MCKQIHHQLTREFKYALVWGLSAKHSPQRVGLTHQLADEDVVQVRPLSKSCCFLGWWSGFFNPAGIPSSTRFLGWWTTGVWMLGVMLVPCLLT